MTNQATTNEKKKPTHIAYVVKDNPNAEKGFFNKIGAGWLHRDGNGISIELFAQPLDGRLVLRTVKEDEARNPDLDS